MLHISEFVLTLRSTQFCHSILSSAGTIINSQGILELLILHYFLQKKRTCRIAILLRYLTS